MRKLTWIEYECGSLVRMVCEGIDNRNLASYHAKTYPDPVWGWPSESDEDDLRYTEELIVILHHAMRELTWMEFDVLVCLVYDIQRN